MKKHSNLKENIKDFIEERIKESYSLIANNRNYEEKYNIYKEMESKFLEKLNNKDLVDNYYNFRDIRMDLDSQELQEAYIIGFRDSVVIHNKEL